MLWLFVLEAQRCRPATIEVAGVNLVGEGQYFRGYREFVCTSRRAEKCRAKQQGEANVRNGSSVPHNLPLRL
jgi:hypothetical protein